MIILVETIDNYKKYWKDYNNKSSFSMNMAGFEFATKEMEYKHNYFKYENLNIQQTKILILFVLSINLSCSNSYKHQNDFSHVLTNDSIKFWNISDPNYSSPFYINSFSFSADGKCEAYNIDIEDKRNIRPTDVVEDDHGISNTWKLINDSIVSIRGTKSKIISFSNDSIVIGDEKGAKIFTLYRIIGPFRVNPKSLKERDSLLIEYKKLRSKNKNEYSESIKIGKQQ